MFCHYKNCSYEELLTLRSLIEEELKARGKQTREEIKKDYDFMVENENLKRQLAELEERFMVEHDALNILKETLKALKKQLNDISNEI